MSKDYVCKTSNPTTIPYTFTNVTTGSNQNLNLPSTATYEVIPFSSNYKASDTATSLASASYIVIAAGDSGVSGWQWHSSSGAAREPTMRKLSIRHRRRWRPSRRRLRVPVSSPRIR